MGGRKRRDADSDAVAEPAAEPWYGYRGYGGYWGRKRRDADSDAEAEPEAEPWYGYRGYGGYWGRKRRSAEAEPWYYGGYGYGGYWDKIKVDDGTNFPLRQNEKAYGSDNNK